MLTWENLKNAKLGEPLDIRELKQCCKAFYGAMAWPHRNPGFALVLAVSQPMGSAGDYREICLLSEYESFDMGELVSACGRLYTELELDCLVGDDSNLAAVESIRRINEETNQRFWLKPSYLLDVDGEGHKIYPMYRYFLSRIKKLLNEKRLFLKASKVDTYLHGIETDKITELEGTLPAIEALGYALDEALRDLKALSLPSLPATTGDADTLSYLDRYRDPERDLCYSGAIDTWDPEKDDDYGEDEAWYHTV